MGLIGKILDYIFAADIPYCPYCGKEGGLCDACLEKINTLRIGCAENSDAEHAGVFCYAEPVRGLVHDFKFNARRYHADYMGKELADMITALGWQADAIAYVPQYGGYHKDRGFNQAKALAEAAAKELGLPLADALICVKRKGRQSRANTAEERRAAVKGKYKGIEKAAAGKRLIIIDDVITTGSTVSECEAALYAAGAAEVKAAAFAVAQHSEL